MVITGKFAVALLGFALGRSRQYLACFGMTLDRPFYGERLA
jgi:hypothetical protein